MYLSKSASSLYHKCFLLLLLFASPKFYSSFKNLSSRSHQIILLLFKITELYKSRRGERILVEKVYFWMKDLFKTWLRTEKQKAEIHLKVAFNPLHPHSTFKLLLFKIYIPHQLLIEQLFFQ
jgi:hypothetical protein